MRNVAVCGKKVKDLMPANKSICEVNLEGVPITFGLISTNPPEFNHIDPQNSQSVLIKVKAFSCNYRDRALIFVAMRRGMENSFYPVGSEFVAEVIAVGAEVTKLRIGDRVIGNNSYGDSVLRSNGVMDGIPTNNASKEFHVLHQGKLIKIPAEMTDVTAAAFSIGAQTVYSMIRKLGLEEGTNVLVTAAKSNTSLFAISALRKHQVNVYATSTSVCFTDELKALGVKEIIQLKMEDGKLSPAHPDALALINEIGPFHYVIDPFFDMHLSLVLQLMEAGGKYATCGRAGQLDGIAENQPQHRIPDIREVLTTALLKNNQIIANCLGVTEDLESALEDYKAGDFRVIIDSVYQGIEVGGFFDRTFNSRERFGKVIYAYV